jgi:hypothetical protein
LRREDCLKTAILRESADNTSLTEEEKRDIENLLVALHDLPYWHRNILLFVYPSAYIGDNVELSEERKTYLALFVERGLLPENKDEWDKDLVDEIQAVRVLGEYNDGTIILYINNIKDCASENNAPGISGKPYLSITRYVYLHELMHAFFAREENKGYDYNREKEEGFAEFGALLLLDELVNTIPDGDAIPELNHASKEELEWAIRHVEKKKGALECYSRGADLFRQFGKDKELCKRMLEAYPKAVE